MTQSGRDPPWALQLEIVLRPVASEFEVLVDFEVWGSGGGRRIGGLGTLPWRRLPWGKAFGSDAGGCG
jgi:hypothetical protein